ncbi:MAG: VIT domain-containing protein [Planctomycetota bacterium]|jgi:hypothetical protein
MKKSTKTKAIITLTIFIIGLIGAFSASILVSSLSCSSSSGPFAPLESASSPKSPQGPPRQAYTEHVEKQAAETEYDYGWEEVIKDPLGFNAYTDHVEGQAAEAEYERFKAQLDKAAAQEEVEKVKDELLKAAEMMVINEKTKQRNQPGNKRYFELAKEEEIALADADPKAYRPWSSIIVGSQSGESSIIVNSGSGVSLMPMELGEKGIPALASFSEDELWVIARPETTVAADEDAPSCGGLMAKLPGEDEEIPLPLKHTDVRVQISGYIATVEVTQQFHNPYSEKIEAVYVFPLPQNAAVNEFIMVIGERRIRGIIREREEAERIYEQARSQGHVASLLTQERPNIFTQKVANIEPENEININIKYFNTLTYVDGWYEFVFPMVVGPRFNPPGYSDGVGAVGHGKYNTSGQKTEIQYLKPGERSGHDISLSLDIHAGTIIEEVICTSHVITENHYSSENLTVRLNPLDSIPNKDFVLRYKVAGDTIKSADILLSYFTHL